MKGKLILILIFFSFQLFSLFLTIGCEKNTVLNVENYSSETVEVLINGNKQGILDPGEHVTINTSSIPVEPPSGDRSRKYLVEAKEPLGKVIYSQEFTWQELHNMKWKIVIPPKSR